MTLAVRASADTTADREALLAFSTSEPVGSVDRERFTAGSATGSYRPGWSWLAFRNGRVVGRALWWGRPGAAAPATLDDVQVDADENRAAVAAALVTAATATFRVEGARVAPEWILDVDTEWRDDPDAVAAVAWRTRAAEGAGLGRVTERVRFRHPDPATGAAAAPGGRLRFRGGDDAEFADLFARVAVGSLDAHTLATVRALGRRGAALDDLSFYRDLPGSRDAWRIGADEHGIVVGFVLATRTAHDPAVSFIGVLPQHRGHGYVDDLLREALRLHASDGEDHVVGTTDDANTPMRRAFERAGFRVVQRRIVLEP
ncbi:GNAT family N-acetyltransferase [Curtobacterium sp. SP.BCp]|uniref:GNAT family N-acetyltransferase n=1 Tax=Curtobacterium sp. SP.BCp TaxID=3435230 RepID=UPI003F74175B